MKQVARRFWLACLAPMLILPVLGALPGAGRLEAAVSSGMSLNVYVDEAGHPDLRYILGVDPIKVTVVIKNTTQWPINTDRGFSQVDLFKALILTDPDGKKHAYSEQSEKVFDVLPSISFNQTPTSRAEILPAGWVRSTLIEDLRRLFPMMNTTPGWYSIEAQQPFVRFAWTIQAGNLGLLGPQQDPNNWHGTIDSNKIQLYVDPAFGAQIKARVLDTGSQPAQPIAQVPVRVFEANAIPPDNTPAQTWDKVKFSLEGTTDPAGYAVWDSESDVTCLPEAQYMVIARYLDQYAQGLIESGAEAGWAAGCQAAIVTELNFGAPPAIPGDLDGDGDVDYDDYLLFRTAYGACSGNNKFIPKADLDADGCITINDYRILRTLMQ